MLLEDFRSQIKYSPKSSPAGESRSSGLDGIRYISFGGNDHVTYVWFNDSKRNANLNRFEDVWYDNCWFSFVRYSLHSPPPLRAGFLFLEKNLEK
ncbi:hypothetical protein A2W48_02345 [Candidatus Giovannonibacteria bacterium RIFCSPHIGHO2_12_44_12]|uniref:Uncharacterized protein n=1 Tax=Candidatus Giovannonibacteria bacterium RIFCSPHIGHO2_12_44_12 TaxID=1798340 RepID=A0A1F5WZV7_9BACT|nr:MAG: hypothetical protein A2W48_02345 [Candidatus Giovannonibacteria bacterium RIFCSPHIGHO2_12_44_12]